MATESRLRIPNMQARGLEPRAKGLNGLRKADSPDPLSAKQKNCSKLTASKAVGLDLAD
jgi:hypothetical protein